MGKFSKKRGKSTPAISTASLPDIIFMLLFFFMVATIVKPYELMVVQVLPEATQLRKIEKKSLVTYFNVGEPKNQSTYGESPKIQFNDVFIELNSIPYQVEKARNLLSEPEKDQLIISLKIDESVKMGLVNDIESQLKKVNALKILYNTFKYQI